jgi:hypothetical protein
MRQLPADGGMGAVEAAMDEGVSAQEVLGLFGRFEPLHLPFPTPCRSM